MSKKIIDCFLFYNELDMLRYRLEILNDYVDYFVLVESNHTFSGREKPLYYNLNKDLFEKYQNKIIFVMVHDMPFKFPNINYANNEQWKNESYQRNCLRHGIEFLKLNDDDVILLSDVDEIPDPEIIENIRKNNIIFDVASLEQDFYYYNLQTKHETKWYLSKVFNYKTLKEMNVSLHELRMMATNLIIPKSGWHLSYFGDIKSKIMDFSHQEFNKEEFTDENKIAQRVANFKDLFDRAEYKLTRVTIKDNMYLPPLHEKLISPSVALVINSCKKFYDKTIDKLLESSRAANIPHYRIYVVVGECEKETDIIHKHDHNVVFCRYVNEAYNAAIYFTQSERGKQELNKYTHIFYAHDTSVFLENFWININKYAKNCQSYIKLERQYTKNIGFFNVKWLIENKTELLSYFVNYDKTLIMEYKGGHYKNKDIIYSKFDNLAEYLNEDCMFMFAPPCFHPIGEFFVNNNKEQYKIKIYSDEERLATVYLEPGIIKYQKNWGQEQQSVWNLTP